MNPFSTALRMGHDVEALIRHASRVIPGMGPRIQKALSMGYTMEQIADYLAKTEGGENPRSKKDPTSFGARTSETGLESEKRQRRRAKEAKLAGVFAPGPIAGGLIGAAAGGLVGGVPGAIGGAVAGSTGTADLLAGYEQKLAEGSELSFADYLRAAGKAGAKGLSAAAATALFQQLYGGAQAARAAGQAAAGGGGGGAPGGLLGGPGTGPVGGAPAPGGYNPIGFQGTTINVGPGAPVPAPSAPPVGPAAPPTTGPVATGPAPTQAPSQGLSATAAKQAAQNAAVMQQYKQTYQVFESLNATRGLQLLMEKVQDPQQVAAFMIQIHGPNFPKTIEKSTGKGYLQAIREAMAYAPQEAAAIKARFEGGIKKTPQPTRAAQAQPQAQVTEIPPQEGVIRLPEGEPYAPGQERTIEPYGDLPSAQRTPKGVSPQPSAPVAPRAGLPAPKPKAQVQEAPLPVEKKAAAEPERILEKAVSKASPEEQKKAFDAITGIGAIGFLKKLNGQIDDAGAVSYMNRIYGSVAPKVEKETGKKFDEAVMDALAHIKTEKKAAAENKKKVEPAGPNDPLTILFKAVPRVKSRAISSLDSKLKSSNVLGAFYDRNTGIMRTIFNDGSAYEYDNVPFDVFEKAVEGNQKPITEGENTFGVWFKDKEKSIGAAFNREIIKKKEEYPYIKLEKSSLNEPERQVREAVLVHRASDLFAPFEATRRRGRQLTKAQALKVAMDSLREMSDDDVTDMVALVEERLMSSGKLKHPPTVSRLQKEFEKDIAESTPASTASPNASKKRRKTKEK